mgnify:CR=1 FL=1
MPRRRKLVSIRKPRLRVGPAGPRITAPSARVGGKVGLNISKRGVSASARTKAGTFTTGKMPLGPQKSKKSGCASVILVLMLVGLGVARLL